MILMATRNSSKTTPMLWRRHRLSPTINKRKWLINMRFQHQQSGSQDPPRICSLKRDWSMRLPNLFKQHLLLRKMSRWLKHHHKMMSQPQYLRLSKLQRSLLKLKSKMSNLQSWIHRLKTSGKSWKSKINLWTLKAKNRWWTQLKIYLYR